MNPQRSPNACRTQTQTPPSFGHPVANSADINAEGIKKVRPAKTPKKIIFIPISAIVGRLRILTQKAEVIIMSVNKLILSNDFVLFIKTSFSPFYQKNILK